MASNCKIVNEIVASLDDVMNDHYIVNGSNGITYKIPIVCLEVKDGTVLRLQVPEPEEDSSNQVIMETEKRWRDSVCKLLICRYNEYRSLVTQRKIKTIKKMWERIMEDLHVHNYNYSLQQVESKWKTLDRAFKNTILNNKKTGRSRKRCAYESELAEIFLPKKSVVPPCLIDEERTVPEKEIIASSGIAVESFCEQSDVSTRSTTEQTNIPTTKVRNKEMLLLAEAINKAIATQQQEQLIEQIVENKLLKEILSLLKKNNE